MANRAITGQKRRRRFFAGLAIAALVFPSAVHAGWREELGTFRIGMVAGGRTQADLARLREAYSAALGMKAEIVLTGDLAALIDAQASSRVEYAVYTALAYGAADRLCACVEPLAAPVSASGATGIRAMLIGRTGSFDALAAGLKGKVAIGPLDSVPAELLLDAGLVAGGRKLAAATDVLAAHASQGDAVSAFVAGDADGLAGWAPSTVSGTLDGGVPAALLSAGAPQAGWQILWTSRHFPNGPHAVRKNLPGEAKAILTGFLTGLAAAAPETYQALEQEFGGGFVKAGAADYAIAGQLAGHMAGKP